jgi:hypothetical protein
LRIPWFCCFYSYSCRKAVSKRTGRSFGLARPRLLRDWANRRSVGHGYLVPGHSFGSIMGLAGSNLQKLPETKSVSRSLTDSRCFLGGFAGRFCWLIIRLCCRFIGSKGGISKGPTTIGKVSSTNWFLYIASVMGFLDWFVDSQVNSDQLGSVKFDNSTLPLYV